MSEELKPCPFCGAKADMQNDFGVEYWVQCTNLDCGATDGTVHIDPNSAAQRWNRRAAKEPCKPVATDEQINAFKNAFHSLTANVLSYDDKIKIGLEAALCRCEGCPHG